MVSKRGLTKKSYEMSQASCLLVGLFQKLSRLYPHISSPALAATETVCRDSGL